MSDPATDSLMFRIERLELRIDMAHTKIDKLIAESNAAKQRDSVRCGPIPSPYDLGARSRGKRPG